MMKRIILLSLGYLSTLLLCLSAVAQTEKPVQYYFKTLDVRNGLSQNTVYQILQDRTGFMWFGTKEGLNRYDGLTFRIYKKENSALGRNFITALHEDNKGNIWIGTDGGVYVYNPISDSFHAFSQTSDKGTQIKNYITQISEDENHNVWISAEEQGLFCYHPANDNLQHFLNTVGKANINRFWINEDKCWIALYGDNLYFTSLKAGDILHPFKDKGGNESFKGDIVNCQVEGSYNRLYIASSNGLTEIDLTSGKTERLLDTYARTLQFKSDDELWIGTETGLYIYSLSENRLSHLTVPEQDDSYALSDNAIYSLCRDREDGMWIGSYFGGVNYYAHQYTYFEKVYPRGEWSHFGRRVREICESNDGTLWIGTEDKGLFNYNPANGTITPFKHQDIYRNVHGLCLDGNYLWVGTFSRGLNRINLSSGQVKHYAKGNGTNAFNANDAFSICRTNTGDIWIGSTSGLFKYNRDTDNFTQIPQLKNIFTYKILEDSDGKLWFATYAKGVFCYNPQNQSWHNYLYNEQDSTSLAYDKVISIYEDSKKRLWFMTLGGGFCRYNPDKDNFTRYNESQGFPGNTIYTMIEDKRGNLWLTSNYGLVCFNPETGNKHIYTTSNGLLSNQFNYQSSYKDKSGYIYLGTLSGMIIFNPETFVEDTFVPPVVITDFWLFNKRQTTNPSKPILEKSITYSDKIELESDQNFFSLQVAALSYRAPEMNKLEYMLEGFDKEWNIVRKDAIIAYSKLPYGNYRLHIKGSNSDEKWNETERILDIYICPPFYLTSWAYLIYAIIGLCLLIAMTLSYKHRTLRRQARAMESFEREKERELYTAKIEFFTNVAHEIRTPLTLIKSPLENVLASGAVNKEIKDDLEIMDLNTNRLLDLVNQLLDFRKTEAKGFQLNFIEYDVAELLHTTCKRFMPITRQKNLTLTVETPQKLSVSIDKEGMTKIISNLLTNATKYSEHYIHVHLSSEKEDTWQLRIANDGPVIPTQMREEIFKPFVQYKDGITSPAPGTGIGLALARLLAELHGGTLRMDDTTEENCFVLSLPLKHERTFSVSNENISSPTDIVSGKSEKEDEPPATNHFRYTILVVEDNIDMQNFIIKQLASQYHIFTATNGVEALKVLEKEIVNLVISDIMMPEMDGMELCKYLKSELDYSHIPVILLTAKTTMQAKIAGMKLGADAYIEKPFSVEYLKVCITNLLDNREKLRTAFTHSPFVQTNSIAMTKADETFLKTLNGIVMENMENPDFGPDDMAALLHISRSSLNRKIKGILDMTPNDYIRLERLKKAAQLLKENNYKINEVCYMTGFNTPSYFAKCFQKQFGLLPKDFVNHN